MPAHRTTSSFAESSALSLPLSSHGAAHAPSLERGKACLVCRTRKVKCDGVKPACSSCKRSATAHGENPETVICNFDDADKPQKRKRVGDANAGAEKVGDGKVALLEAKIAELEQIIAGRSTSSNLNTDGFPPLPAASSSSHQPIASTSNFDPRPPPVNSDSLPPFASSSTSFYSPPNNSFNPTYSPNGSTSRKLQNNFDVLLEATTHSQQQHQYILPPIPWDQLSTPFGNRALHEQGSGSGIGRELGQASMFAHVEPTDALLELFYPGWPSSLPSPAITNRLIDVYFAKSHAASGMINQSRFLTSMTLPPKHFNFPHLSLIHAMLATASRMVSASFFEGEEQYWRKLGGEGKGPSEYHSVQSRSAIDEAISKGTKLFQVAQAINLICFDSYTSARFVEVWTLCGMATRVCTPLGLNHLRAYTESSAVEVEREAELRRYSKKNLIQTTYDEEELYERSVTFWISVICDRFASASTGWASALDEEDITSILPSPTGAYLYDGEPHLSPLNPKNPSFLMAHPPHLVQSLQLYIKAVILLGRVMKFMQRAPAPIGMSVNIPKPTPGDLGAFADIRQSTGFKQLDADAVTFRLSIPREYQNTSLAVTDTKMCLVYALPHTATILLHEPFCTMADMDVSLAKCLLSARAILEAIYTLWSSSYEIALLAPFISFTWSVAGRTLVRELAIKRAKNDKVGQDQIVSDVATIISTMRASRSPLGESCARALQELLNDPDTCLPHQNLKHLGLGYGYKNPGILTQKITEIQPRITSDSTPDSNLASLGNITSYPTHHTRTTSSDLGFPTSSLISSLPVAFGSSLATSTPIDYDSMLKNLGEMAQQGATAAASSTGGNLSAEDRFKEMGGQSIEDLMGMGGGMDWAGLSR